MVCTIWKLCYWGSEPKQLRLPNPAHHLTLSELVRLTSPRVIGTKHSIYFQLVFVCHRSWAELIFVFWQNTVITSLCSVFFTVGKSKSPLHVKY